MDRAGRSYEYGNSGGGAHAKESTRPQLTSAKIVSYTAYKYPAGSDGRYPVVSGAADATTGGAAVTPA